MYQSKTKGRNTLRFFDQLMQEAINNRADIERDLSIALEQEQFQLHYQIQVDSDGVALGAEALIRWLHPLRNMIHPNQFISIAEECGLIIPIGHWVLNSACAQLKAWEKNPLTQNLSLSVNISAKQFHQVDFVDEIKAMVLQYAIKPNLLKLELTENILADNIEPLILNMGALKDFGIQFELDDFGTGYSSLQYLKRLPLQQLKIDRSFVRDIAFDNSDRVIVKTIIAMADSLDLKVIAEGVETEVQRQFLESSGCMRYQGYLFSKPVPIDDFEVLLENL
jgi:EAL domain-containing protein (putative c-di-GMP-specific phosphodiesterase class I)